MNCEPPTADLPAPIRILLVEDDPDSGEAMVNMLERRGVAVAWVRDGEEGVRRFGEGEFDVLVVDIRLADMSGVDVLRRVRLKDEDFPVILVTAYDSLQSAIDAVRLDAQDYILKPFDGIEDLIVPVKRAVKHHRALLENRALEEQMRSFAVKLESVREEERSRISGEIHDELGQSLTALKMDLAWLQKHVGASKAPVLNRIDGMRELTDGMLEAVKRISTELRPAMLDDLGVCAAIEWLTDEFAKHSDIECNVDLAIPEGTVGKEGSTALFRAAQEALTNVIRHADASRVSVNLAMRGNSVELTVKDNLWQPEPIWLYLAVEMSSSAAACS